MTASDELERMAEMLDMDASDPRKLRPWEDGSLVRAAFATGFQAAANRLRARAAELRAAPAGHSCALAILDGIVGAVECTADQVCARSWEPSDATLDLMFPHAPIDDAIREVEHAPPNAGVSEVDGEEEGR
jgi:hypothetical protein